MPDDANPVPRPAASLNDLMWSFTISQAIFAAAKLSVFDALADGPKTSHEIAGIVGAHELSLRRLLRALTTVNLLTEDASGCFAATAIGEPLRSDHPQSARPMAVLLGSSFNWQPWGELSQAILKGETGFSLVYDVPFFDYFQQHPDDGAIFNAAMTAGSISPISSFLDAYDFSEFSKIVDVGGGHGALLRGILEHHPQVRAVLCDLPSVIEHADELEKSAVSERCEFIGVDMFKSVPAGGDAYLLKSILHDWNDEECIQILRNIRKAIAPGGKILHIGEVLKPSNEPDFGKLLDLTMMVLLTGRERSEAELGALYAASGFRLTRVIPTADGASIVEGIAV